VVGSAGGERVSDERDSPYAPPASRLRVPPSETQLATTGQRFANYLVDATATIALNFANGFALGLVGSRPGFFGRLALSILTVSIYYVVLEARSGRTLGKLVTGTRVVGKDGSAPALGRVIGRTLARHIPFEPFSFLGGDRPVGWHDSLSGTRVIRTR